MIKAIGGRGCISLLDPGHVIHVRTEKEVSTAKSGI